MEVHGMELLLRNKNSNTKVDVLYKKLLWLKDLFQTFEELDSIVSTGTDVEAIRQLLDEDENEEGLNNYD